MIVWFRHLPQVDLDGAEWKPFIQNPWFRNHFMKFVYFIMAAFIIGFIGLLEFSGVTNVPLGLIVLFVFIIHEVLHILVIYTKGDISLTFSGIFFWLNTDAVLSKRRFWVFMSLPFIGLSVIPAAASLFVSGHPQSLLLIISWVNLIISSSDLVNSCLILLKPNKSEFCRGCYRVK
ncbi:DUF3267 domain-containing protein [Paenibacillus sp. J22TS3]|uniref:DUF3267 domain-containing protein n=1 Tax=Paenibacillus sp. J22TS3 TaxID=2807192 RepID=UPI001BD054B6|nr:DUF3267 domain-containing protein [Paenibacillus sp. J22TS3]